MDEITEQLHRMEINMLQNSIVMMAMINRILINTSKLNSKGLLG